MAALAFNKDLLSDSGISQSKPLTVTKYCFREEIQRPGANSNFQVSLDQRSEEVNRKGRWKRHRKNSCYTQRIPKWEENLRALEIGGPPCRGRGSHMQLYKWRKESTKEPILSSLEREMAYLENRLFWMFVSRKGGKIIINKIPECIRTYILRD